MPCENCECDECISVLENASRKKVKEKYKDWCERWNWNAHPLEIAVELRDEHNFNDIYAEEFQELLDVVETFFSKSTRDNLKETCDYIFDM
jgi:predicted nuclease with TOPRIM domain